MNVFLSEAQWRLREAHQLNVKLTSLLALPTILYNNALTTK